ncbi:MULTISPECIES: glycosyltransferase family 2 protein [Derxia]|uniref:Glycosyltransferase family 2 protein n=1 Tax=Derxia gummosa DSM 723 TaxID=1121388 RepID=A0A8B6X880_9BURK|nr:MULTISPECIES: glycosyltransferase family 2 protein [Derxia]
MNSPAFPSAATPATTASGIRPSRFTLSCIVPAYNEVSHIARFIAELHAAVRPLADEVEIIAINDGSRDATAAEIERVAGQYGVCLLDLSRNFGKEAALTAGLEGARGDCVLIIDSDFQHPFGTIGPMIERWKAGVDMIYGVRTDRDDEHWAKRAGTKAFYALMSRGSAVPIPPDAGDFRLMDRRVADAILQLPERNRFMKGLYAWVGFRSESIEFEVRERESGVSSFNFKALRRLAMTGLVAFTDLPLKAVRMAGAFISVLAALYGLWIVFERVCWGEAIPGFATVAASIMFFAGVQMFSIGIIGEYLGRVYTEVKRRPTYIVGRRVDCSPLAGRPHHAGFEPNGIGARG